MESNSKTATRVIEKSADSYSELLKRPEWLLKREMIIKRDGHRCLNCGSFNNLQVHHRQYHTHSKSSNFKNPWQYKDRYLVTLCLECHQAGHKYFKIPVFNV